MKTVYKKTSVKDVAKIKDANSGLLLEGLSSWGQDIPNKTFNNCLIKNVVAESSLVENNAWSHSRSEGLNLRESVIQNSIFSHCVLPETNFEACAFEGVSFFSSNLRSSNFKGASFEGCSFEKADLSQCDFRGADLSESNLYDCQSLLGAIFDRSTILPFSPAKAKELGMVMTAFKLVTINESKVSDSETPTSVVVDNVIDLAAYRKLKQ